jgi:hypothetical protein
MSGWGRAIGNGSGAMSGTNEQQSKIKFIDFVTPHINVRLPL